MSAEPDGRHDIEVVRHGETEWSRHGRHTGRTDIALTANGRDQAAGLAPLLAQHSFALVLTSPLQRAFDTCRLAGFGDVAVVDDNLVEWDYGVYEGRTTVEIRGECAGWSLWRDGVPGGETGADVARRADRVIERCRAASGDVLVFSHAHFLRVLAARWVGFEADGARVLVLGPATSSVLGWEREQRVINRWNCRG